MAKATLPSGPFMRYVSAVESHIAPQDAMVSGSQEMLVDPIAGGAFKRSGMLTYGYGETLDTNYRAVNGMLNSNPGWIPARLRESYATTVEGSNTQPYASPSILYRKDSVYNNWHVRDDGVFGTDYVRLGTANYQLLSEFGGTCYPTGGGSHTVEVKYKVVPFWYESGEGGYTRGSVAEGDFTQRFVASGSWNTVDIGRWRYYPNLYGTPLRWDGGCNISPTTITNSIRVTPTGPFPPLWAPTAAAANSVAVASRTAAYPWVDGDTYYLSVMYQFEDGSYSVPTTPRAPNTNLPNGLGFVTVGTIAGGNVWKQVDYSNIPLGPDGTIARVLLRTKKQNRLLATDLLTIDISDLRVIGVLRNNTQTTYSDYAADDDSLLQDSDVVRWDLICPPRARYYGTGDQRVIAGYTLPNQSAIQISCIGAVANYDMNLNDTSAALTGTTEPVYRITESALELAICNPANGDVLATSQIAWASYSTLQDVVDKVNSIALDATHGQWRAQVAPGADPFAPSTGLCPTVWTGVSSTSAASTTLTVDAATMLLIPIGYKIYDSAGKISAGTYVVKKLSTTQLHMSAAASGAGSAAALVFYAECGDEACVTTAGSKGWIRTFGSAYPGMVYFKRSAQVGYNRPNKHRIYFTISSPGAAATGVSLAANAWAASNRRDGPGETGQVMGIADVQGAAIIAYRNKIGIFENQRGSNTGEDFDYRIFPVNNAHGCVSPWSVISAAGCAVYATAVGLKACDKQRKEILLSGEIYQPARNMGEFGFEIGTCIDEASRDGGEGWMAGATYGNRLVYSYRVSSSQARYIVYDFSPGADQNGVEALADPVARRPYGWSSPCLVNNGGVEYVGARAMGAVAAGNGLSFFGAMSDNAGAMDGRIDRLFYGTTDNGMRITAVANGKLYLAPTGSVFSAQNLSVTHSTAYSGVYAYMVRELSGWSAGGGLLVTAAGTNPVMAETLQWYQSARSPSVCQQVQWYDDVADATGGLVWQMEQEVEVLPKAGG